MKINKSFLSKIIKEEIKRVLYEDEPSWTTDAINLFMDIRDNSRATNPDHDTKENFIKQIEDLTGRNAGEVFSYLRGKIDKDLYVHVAQLLNIIHNMDSTFNNIFIITKNKDEPLYNFLEAKLGDKP